MRLFSRLLSGVCPVLDTLQAHNRSASVKNILLETKNWCNLYVCRSQWQVDMIFSFHHLNWFNVRLSQKYITMLKWLCAWGCIDGDSPLDTVLSEHARVSYGILPVLSTSKRNWIYIHINKRQAQPCKSTQHRRQKMLPTSVRLWEKGIMFAEKEDWVVSLWMIHKISSKSKTSYISFNLQQFLYFVSLNASAICFHDIFLVLVALLVFINQIIHLYPIASAMIANPTGSQNGYKVKLF